MIVEPNERIDQIVERIFCENGRVLLHDGRAASSAELSSGGGELARFCQSLDPNRCFIVAHLPRGDADRELFFAARQVAAGHGIHMQATMEQAEVHRQTWERYVAMKAQGQQEPNDG